jgi:mannose-6-phosphate isomerase-like protein (cupin superfamily)
MTAVRGFLVPAGTGRPTRVPVADATFKAVGDDTDGAFTFLEYVMSRDIPAHVHPREQENLYILEGRVRAHVGDDEFVAGVGDFVFMPRGLPHSLTALSDTPPRFLTVSSPSGFEHFMEDLMEVLAVGHDRSSPEVAAVREKHGWTPQ